MKIVVLYISGKKQLDEWMHHFDLFESCKRLGNIGGLEIEVDDSTSKEKIDGFVQHMRDALEAHGDIVTAVWLKHKPEIHYVDWSVKVTSDGKKFVMLEPLLAQYGVLQNVLVEAV